MQEQMLSSFEACNSFSNASEFAVQSESRIQTKSASSCSKAGVKPLLSCALSLVSGIMSPMEAYLVHSSCDFSGVRGVSDNTMVCAGLRVCSCRRFRQGIAVTGDAVQVMMAQMVHMSSIMGM